MWARVIELMLSLFLSISLFIFPGAFEHPIFWVNDLICASIILLCALLSYHRRLYRMHFISFLVSLYLIAIGYLHTEIAPPPAQNELVIGLLLLMFTLIPSHSSAPPKKWQLYKR